MDDKTAELRDLFVDVTDTETVTDRQSESRGSFPTDDAEIDDRVRAVIERMDEQCGVDTPLSNEELVTVVRGFLTGDDDATIASRLDDHDPDAVTDARIQLHLLTDEDLEEPGKDANVRERLENDESVDAIAAELSVDASRIRRYRRVVAAQEERRRVGDRFRQSFEIALGESAMSDRLTEGVDQDGLEDATEDIETNVSF